MTRGTTGVWYITVYQYDGTTPQDLTGSTLTFNATVDDVNITKSSPSSGITVTNASGGLATLTIDAADTTDVDDDGTFVGPCELQLTSSGDPYELNSGTLTVYPNVVFFSNNGGGSGSTIAFSAITAGTNTSAAMVVGTGASLTTSGSGTINASSIEGITITGTPSVGYVPTATSASAATWQVPTGGSGSPSAPADSIQFNSSGSFGGSADLQWIDTALPTPDAPTVTQGGTPGSTNYAYAISWNGLVGASATGAAQATATGPAALDGTNFNIIDPGAAPAGATSYSVFRTVNDGSVPSNGLTLGLIPLLGMLGSPFHDIGYETEVDPFVTDTSRGVYTTQKLRVTGYGDAAEPFAVLGQPITDFTADIGFAFEHAGVVVSAAGSFNNLFYPLVVVAEGTTNNAVPTAAWLLSSANGSGNQIPLLVTGETHGTATVNNQTHNITSRIIALNPNSTLTLGVHFDAQSVFTVGPVTSLVGHNVEDWTTKGSTSTYGFRSLLSAGTGVWAFYGGGTAASHFGGNVDAVSLITPAVAVASLPGSPVAGQRAFVNDSNAISFAAGVGTIVANGGTTKVPVFYDGTNWLIG